MISRSLAVLGARSITHLVDVLPHAGAAVVAHQGIPVLCNKLMTIEYIDLAEQCLQVPLAVDMNGLWALA